jgi:plastocyanin
MVSVPTMRGAGIALLTAVGGMLLSPASPLAGEPPAPPQAVLETPSTNLQAGKSLELDSSKSTPGTGAIVDHLWDLDGNGSFETDTGPKPTADLTPARSGPLTVAVRVVDDQGQSSDAKLDLNVTDPPTTAGSITDLAGSSTGQGQGAATVAARTTTAPALVPPKRLRHARHPATSRTKARTAATVRAASSAGVTIKNFTFVPGTSTVRVGDTITWTNQDIAPHTATAKDHSFDTGTINKNKTGSHTFTKAGTFPYICTIHPNMKGTVTVLASSSSGSGGSSGGSSSGSSSSGSGSGSGSTTPSSSSSSSSSLPHTGLDIAVLVFIAMCLTGSGASLRRALR